MKYTPTLEEARALASSGNVVPIYREVPADLETPVSAFLKVARGRHSFLLESVEGGERFGRYSFIGTEPYRVLRTGESAIGNETAGDPLVEIEDELRRFTPVRVDGLPRFHGGAVGYMAYECARYYEKLPVPDADPQGVPEAIFLFVDTLLVFDHLQHKIKVVSHARLDGDVEAAYRQATWKIEELVGRLARPLSKLPYDTSNTPRAERKFASNNTRWLVTRSASSSTSIAASFARKSASSISPCPFVSSRAPTSLMRFTSFVDCAICAISARSLPSRNFA